MFVGLDVHKNSVQVAAVDEIGKLLFNKKISSDFSAISKITSKIPKNAKYVLESSSVLGKVDFSCTIFTSFFMLILCL